MTTKDLSEDRRTQILSAATRVVRTRGLQALSFETIAAEAGSSRQLVRYYFPDTEALIVALCDFYAAGYRDALVRGIVDIGRADRLDFFLDFFFDLADGHPMPDNLAVYDSLLAYAVGSGPVSDALCGSYLTLGKVIEHEIAIVHPQLAGHACEELSYLFVSMMHAHWSFVASLGYAAEHGRLTRKAIDRLIRSYLADQSSTIDKPWARDRH